MTVNLLSRKDEVSCSFMVIGAVAQPARTVAEAINKIGWKKRVFTINPLVSALVQCGLAALPDKY